MPYPKFILLAMHKQSQDEPNLPISNIKMSKTERKRKETYLKRPEFKTTFQKNVKNKLG